MIGINEAVQRAIDTHSNLYNQKRSCPDNKRDAELRNLYELARIAPEGAAAEMLAEPASSSAKPVITRFPVPATDAEPAASAPVPVTVL